jgi:hypothetical protein
MKMPDLKPSIPIAVLPVALMLFFYCLWRALVLEITWDEAYTYFHFIRHELFIQEKVESMSANNHWLNNWLCILFVRIFGFKIWVLRIPALIGCGLQLFYSWKILQKINKGYLGIAAFIIVNAHPFLLDFFSLSRGYGLSIGCMTAAIYFVLSFLENSTKKNFALATFFCLMALMASFVMLPVIAFLMAVMPIFSFWQNKNKGQSHIQTAFKTLKNYLPSVVMFALLTAYIIYYSFQLKNVGALYFGGHDGLLESTFFSIFYFLIYEGQKLMAYSGIGRVLLLLLPVLVFIIGLWGVFQKKKSIFRICLLISATVLFCILSAYLQFIGLNNLLPVSRTALYLYVLIVLSLASLLLTLSADWKTARFILVFVAFISVVFLIRKANTEYVLEWKNNYVVGAAMKDLKDDWKKTGNEAVSIGIGEGFNYLFNFYRDYENLHALFTIHEKKGDHPLHDYYFGEKGRFKADGSKVLLKTYMNGEYELWKNTLQFHEPKLIYEDSIRMLPSNAASNLPAGFLNKEREFSENFEIGLDSMPKSAFKKISVSGNFAAINPYQCNTYLVITHENKGNMIDYLASSIRDFIERKEEWIHMEHEFLLSQNIQPGDCIKA